MAALDFPSSPTLNQQFAAPNGVTYKWDGTAWVVLGGSGLWTQTAKELLPTDATVTDVRLGAGQTVQTRVGSWGTAWANAAGITTNEALTAGGAPDDPTKPQTEVDLDNDGSNLWFVTATPASPGPSVKTSTLQVSPVGMTLTGRDGQSMQNVIYTFGAGQTPAFQGGAARGTKAAPLPVQSGDNLVYFAAAGQYGSAAGNTAQQGFARFVATETWSATARGNRFEVITTPNGSTAVAINAFIDGSGNLTITGATATKASG